MIHRRGEIQVFSMSFLDVLSCALGGVLLLLFTMSPEPLAPPTPPSLDPPPSPLPSKPEPGFLLPIVLAARIDWDKPVDIDFWIKDPSTTGRKEFIYFGNARSKVGFLMRDARQARDKQWEIYYTVDTHPGVYEFYAHYFSGSSEPVEVSLAVDLFPGEANLRQRFRSDGTTTLRRSQHGKQPGKLMGRFEIKCVGDEYRLEQLSP